MSAGSLFSSLAWFIAIVALIPLALWLLKRSPVRSGGPNGVMRSVAVLSMAPNQRLVTVEVGQGPGAAGCCSESPRRASPCCTRWRRKTTRRPPPPQQRHSRNCSAACTSAKQTMMHLERRASAGRGCRRTVHALALASAVRPFRARPGAAGRRQLPAAGDRTRRRWHHLLGADPDAAVLHRPVVPARAAAADDRIHAHRHRARRCCARRWARRPRRPTR